MRAALVLASLLAATPALAGERPRPHVAPDPAEVARALQNPRVREGAATALERLADIVLDTRVGPLAALADPNVAPDATLGDLQRRDDPDFDARLHHQARSAVRAAAALAATGAEVQRTADRLQAALAPLIGALDHSRRDE